MDTSVDGWAGCFAGSLEVRIPFFSMLPSMGKGQERIGPRGGTTTRKKGQVKKTVWLNEAEAEALRRTAYEQHRSDASIIREVLRAHFGLDD